MQRSLLGGKARTSVQDGMQWSVPLRLGIGGAATCSTDAEKLLAILGTIAMTFDVSSRSWRLSFISEMSIYNQLIINA